MPRLALNKASLTRESRRLRTFERFLPSLDLKRRQLIAERNKATRLLLDLQGQMERLEQSVANRLPMMARHGGLHNLVHIARVQIDEENLLGTRLPRLQQVDLQRRDYPLLGSAPWLDRLTEQLSSGLALQVRLSVQAERLARLEQAVRKVTQRVNLFEKVLIPRARANIKRIAIFLSDAERAAVVRAKIARAKAVRERSFEHRGA